METFDSLLVFGDIGLLFLRISVGATFIYHALPKFKEYKKMAKAMGMPHRAVIMLGIIELVSGTALIFGFLVQISAMVLSVIMLGAIFMKSVKWKVPFAAHNKTGWEFDLILLVANIVILTTGGGSVVFF